MQNERILQDMDKAIEVMFNVGNWMENSGLETGEWWKPENMNREFLLKHTEPNEYFVITIDDKPAASMVLQETERNQSWKPIDGETPQKALYIHWVCVNRDFAGKGLSKKLIDFAKNEAQKRGFSRLRLDTIAEEKKLCAVYEKIGFVLMGSEKEGEHLTAFYQLDL
jgi:GNAT superfamily N-acetyltransferase